MALHPATPVSEVDVEGTRAARERIRDEVRLRQHIGWLLTVVPAGDPSVQVTKGA